MPEVVYSPLAVEVFEALEPGWKVKLRTPRQLLTGRFIFVIDEELTVRVVPALECFPLFAQMERSIGSMHNVLTQYGMDAHIVGSILIEVYAPD